jgi:RES domain-containing protein
MAEIAVHLTLATLPDDFVMMTVSIPDEISIRKIEMDGLPSGWNSFPHQPGTQRIGDQFVFENKFCLLQVPSAVTQGDYNILINPGHPDFKRIEIKDIQKFPFDNRIFK